jgi:hypothetical protein
MKRTCHHPNEQISHQLDRAGSSKDQARIRPMLGLKSTLSCGIELVHMMRKRQARFAYNPAPTLADRSIDGSSYFRG